MTDEKTFLRRNALLFERGDRAIVTRFSYAGQEVQITDVVVKSGGFYMATPVNNPEKVLIGLDDTCLTKLSGGEFGKIGEF